jgi:RNase adaptor protein for sRNA GlmZ degradation
MDNRDMLIRDTPANTLIAVVITSFGYGHSGVPEAEIVIDLRDALYNPAGDTSMVQLTGLDRRVHEYVMNTPLAPEIAGSTISQVQAFAAALNPRGRKVRVAIGCNGGRHRSVVITNVVGWGLRALGITTEIEHRDVARAVLPATRR